MNINLQKTKLPKKSLHTFLSIIFWIAVWYGLALIKNNSLYLPTPLEAITSLSHIIWEPDFWLNIGFTLLRVMLGLAISMVIGIVLGIAAGLVNFIDVLMSPFVTTIKSIPIISIIIMALLWLGSSFLPIFICILLCSPIVYTNVLHGMRAVDKGLLEMTTIYKLPFFTVVKSIYIPSLKPHIFSALMVCTGLSWKSVITSEVLSWPKYSMGSGLYATKIYLDTPGLFAWTLVIILLSITLEKSVHRLFDSKVIGRGGGK